MTDLPPPPQATRRPVSIIPVELLNRFEPTKVELPLDVAVTALAPWGVRVVPIPFEVPVIDPTDPAFKS